MYIYIYKHFIYMYIYIYRPTKTPSAPTARGLASSRGHHWSCHPHLSVGPGRCRRSCPWVSHGSPFLLYGKYLYAMYIYRYIQHGFMYIIYIYTHIYMHIYTLRTHAHTHVLILLKYIYIYIYMHAVNIYIYTNALATSVSIHSLGKHV